MKPSIKIIQKKNALQDGNYPIYLRITINRKSKFYSLPYKCKLSEWNDKKGEFNSRHRNNINFNKALREKLNEVADIIQEISDRYKKVTLVRFDSFYNSMYKSELTFIAYLDYEIKRQIENGQVSYATSHKQTRNNLFSFQPKIDSYYFEDIDYTFLCNFETFLRKGGANDSGIGVYMRNIRAVFNKAIKAKVVSKNNYPFQDYKISKFKKRKLRRALEPNEINKLIDFNADNYPKGKNALYTYLFSYFARGMNFTDMATLRWSDLSNNRFEYTRNKTGIHLRIKLPEIPKIEEILSFYKLYRPFKTDYIFPILDKYELDYSTKEELMDRKKNVRAYYNKQLKQIGKLVELKSDIYFYNARHSFATKALRENVNLTIIKQSLGHQNISTTENYIQDFKDDDVNKIIDSLF